MFAKFRLGTINLLVSAIIGLAGVLFAVVLSMTVVNIQSIEDSWLQYQADRSEKARLESALRRAIGYGGMIHHFKNYVLRHQEQFLDSTQADIGAARAVVSQYGSLGLSEAEKVALEDIAAVLDNYDEALFRARSLINASTTPREIDDQVKISDTAALRGLNTLRTEVIRLSGAAAVERDIKGRLGANLRAALGYGGMIHEFKNLILRGDLPRIEKINAHILMIEKNIAAYRALEPTIAESIALEDILATVNAYKSKLELTADLIAKNTGVSKIDNVVKVDDAKALRGLNTLDREIALQIKNMAANVHRDLKFLSRVVPLINWTVLFVILVVVASSVWIFRVYVIKPISRMVGLLNHLTTDDTDIAIPHLEDRNEIGQMARALESFRRSIIRRKAVEAEILELAVTDPLTGLYNRKRFDEQLEDMLKLAARTDRPMACLMIDLDRFKPINDTYGHAAGDEVLKVVGERLMHITRNTDCVARLGGDEFGVIATVLDEGSNVEILAKRIVDQLSLPVYFGNNELTIGGSVGISLYPDDGEDGKILTEAADAALYAAKHAGRNTYRFAASPEKK